MTSPPKKSPSSKARRKSPAEPRCRTAQASRSSRGTRSNNGAAPLRREFRAWRASLPTALERDTLLDPLWVAESVVQEAERFLKADLPANFAERLAARAHHLYPRHRHFKKMLNRPGNGGRQMLCMYMRHWTCSWLKREHWSLFKRLPWSYALGRRLPSAACWCPETGQNKTEAGSKGAKQPVRGNT